MPTKHYPYMYCSRTGKGPKNHETERADKWSCTCHKKSRPKYRGTWSLCRCTASSGKRRFRKVWLNLDRKKKYNHMYKRWVREHRRRFCKATDKRPTFPRQGTGLMRPPHIRPAIRLRIKMLARRRGHG